MRKEDVVLRLKGSSDSLRAAGVTSLTLFGSVARDEATPGSDVDLLVEFGRPVGLFQLVALKRQLEEILGCSVDLGTPDTLRPELRERVLQESVVVTP